MSTDEVDHATARADCHFRDAELVSISDEDENNFVKSIWSVNRVVRCPVFDRTVRFFGDLSGQKYDAKPDNLLSGF